MSSPALSKADVLKVATLSRLKLTDDEIQAFTSQLADVLAYIDRLNAVDTENVEPMAHAVEQRNVLRADVVQESLPREAALANAPRTDGRYFLVPRILDGN